MPIKSQNSVVKKPAPIAKRERKPDDEQVQPVEIYYTDLIKDYRKAFSQVTGKKPFSILFKRGGKKYKILKVSLCDESIDTDTYLSVSSRDFKNNPAMFLNFIRYTLAKVVVTKRGKPQWIIKPTKGMVSFMVDQLKLGSQEALRELILDGYMTRVIGGNPDELQDEIADLESEFKKYRAKKEGHISHLEDRLSVLSNQLNELRDWHVRECNPGVSD